MSSKVSIQEEEKRGEEKAKYEAEGGKHDKAQAENELHIRSEESGNHLYSVDKLGSRLNRRSRGSVKLFENLTWLDATEAAEYLRLPSVGVLRVLVCQRKVPFHHFGRRLRFKRLELDRLIESSQFGGN